jgi:hypothetical protein
LRPAERAYTNVLFVSSAPKKEMKTEKKAKQKIFLLDFYFFEIGSGANPYTPLGKGGVGENLGSAYLQYGTRIRDWGPTVPAIGSPFIVIY